MLMAKKTIAVTGILLILIINIFLAAAQNTQLPDNLQKVSDYNQQRAEFYLKNLSFLVAFLVGVVSILSPCSFALIPPFFAITFKEKTQLVKMTLAFFLGFAPVFVIFGTLASFLGKTIGIFQQSNKALVIISGLLLVIFGIMTLFGKGFKGFHSDKKVKRNFWGMLIFGVLFALGFTACMGPALFGILVIAGLLKNYLYSAILMLFYSFGLFIPLFIAAFLFDKYNLSKLFARINKRVGFSITNVIAGIILLAIGLVFIFYGGTFIVEYLGLGSLSTKNYAFQDKIIASRTSGIIGGIVLAASIIALWLALRRKKNENK